jgi:DnaK suppressor protein
MATSPRPKKRAPAPRKGRSGAVSKTAPQSPAPLGRPRAAAGAGSRAVPTAPKRPLPAAKPATRARAPKRPMFDKKTLEGVEKRLLGMREQLQTELEELEEAAFNLSQSELSGEVSYDEDYADAGTFTFEREKDLSIANNVQDLLDKINRSLEKIEEGTYGICEVCGLPIESARLKALPYVLLCVKDKTAEERR